MTRSTQTTPAVSANCDSSSSDSSTGQSVPGMSTPTRIARSGARESRVLDCFSSPAKGINCSAIDSSNSLLCFGLVFLFYAYLVAREPCETAQYMPAMKVDSLGDGGDFKVGVRWEGVAGLD